MSDSHNATAAKPPTSSPDETDHIRAETDHPLRTTESKPKHEWVKFDETADASESSDSKQSPQKGAATTVAPTTANVKSPSRAADIAPAVLDTKSVHVNAATSEHPPSTAAVAESVVVNNNNYGGATTPKNHVSTSAADSPAVIEIPTVTADSGDGLAGGAVVTSNPGLRTIELSSGRVREGFANGDIIVTLLPVNTKWPWITPAVFRPELVPEELMAQGLTLTVEDYVHAMETLVNDYRFTLYNICYKRILCCWIIFAFSVLMGLLFSGLNGIALFSLGVGWLFLNASAIFLCMWLKLRLSRGLERCIAAVNRQLLRHKIIVVLDDRGNISCHKVNLCFMYYEPARCVKYLNDYIARSEQNGVPIEAGWEARLDVEVNDIVIQGSNTTRVSRKQDRGELVLLRYLARWGRDVMRGRADVSAIEPARHCAPFVCPCQYVEAHLKCKPRGKSQYFLVCDGLLSAEHCNSITFIFFSIFLILGIYALYIVDFQRQSHAGG